MKNLKLNSDRIIEAVIASDDYRSESVESCIKDLPFHKHLTIVDSEDEAESVFRNMFADTDSDGGVDGYLKHFGGVHSNKIESFILNVTDPTDDYTHQFKIGVIEYYVDSGSVDYLYGVSVAQL